MVVHDNMLFIYSSYSLVLLDINDSFRKLYSIPVLTEKGDNKCRSLEVNSRHIFIGCDWKIRVCRNAPDFCLYFTLVAIVGSVNTILMLAEDVIACVGSNSAKPVSFVMEVSHVELKSAAVLGDGLIAVDGENGFCSAFFAPPPLDDTVREATLHAYPDPVLGRCLHPLRRSCLQVQDKSLSLYDVCRDMVPSENCSSSLEEWAFGHNILMKRCLRKRHTRIPRF